MPHPTCPCILVFVDYRKAFDSVEINAVLNALVHAGIPSPYIRLLDECFSNTSTTIQLFDRKLKIPIGKGVRQGDTISPKLFTAALQDAMKDLNWDDKGYLVDGKRISNLRFADDIVLISTSTAEVEEMLNEFNVRAESASLDASSQRSSGLEELWSPLRRPPADKGPSKYQSMLSARHSVVLSSRLSSGFTSPLLPKGALAYINGEWVQSQKKKTFNVSNPYNGELLYQTANCDVAEAKKAVAAAREAFVKWSLETTPKQRGAILRKWYDIFVEKEQQLAQLLTLEQGKPLIEARGEIQYSAAFFDWYAGEARRIYGQVVTPAVLNREHIHIREPIGVAVLITPWNFPTAMIARKAGAALAAGCTLIVKPAEDTPLSALALAQTAEEAGIPPGVFNVLPADRKHTAEISKYVCESTDVDAISFTGSTAVGKLLLSQSASTVKRVCLELGGSAPVLIFDSADLDVAVKGSMGAKFRGSGQTCVAANRFFVHQKIHDDYVTKMTVAMKGLVVGDGMNPKTNIGPLINDGAVKKIDELLKDAVGKGAKVVLGGKRGKGTCFQPTLLTNVTDEMNIAHTEIFGPVVAIRKFTDETAVLAAANNSRVGLAGYIFTRDPSQIYRVTRRLQVGMIGVNEGLMSCAEAAFGGVKESGLGREGASQGIDEFTQWKYICTQH